MSISPSDVRRQQDVTPPLSFASQPLTPPLTDKKPLARAYCVIELLRQIQAGKNTKQDTWVEFQLEQGGYDEIESAFQQDDLLSGFVQDKIRYDYDGDKCLLVVRMPTGVHEVFLSGVEYGIWSQLKAICNGTGKRAQFAQRVREARSTEIYFPTSS